MSLFSSKHETWKLNVPDISCEHCETRVKKALEGVSGVSEVRPSAKNKHVTLRVDKSSPPERSAVYSALDEAGYPVSQE